MSTKEKQKETKEKQKDEHLQKRLYTSLYYARYRPQDWGRFAWALLFFIAIYLDDMSLQRRQIYIAFLERLLVVLPNTLPCRSCVRHFIRYMRRHPLTFLEANAVSRWFYHLKQSIRRRLMKKEWKTCNGNPVLQWKCLVKYAQSSYSYDQTIHFYRSMTVQTRLEYVRNYLHFVILTYPDLHEEALGQHQSSQERRESVQVFLGVVLPKILPMPAVWWSRWLNMCADLKTWVNRYTLMIALYQCAYRCGCLEHYRAHQEALDLYINEVHQKLVPARVVRAPSGAGKCACAT